MEQQNGVYIKGRVTKVGKPKLYQYGPKFFMGVRTEQNEYIKAMVEIGDLDKPIREVPFEGDLVEFTAQAIRDGWASVTLKREFKIINNSGQVEKNRIVCENKVQAILNMLQELLNEDYINQKIYKGIEQLLTTTRVAEAEGSDFSHSHHLSSTSASLSPPLQKKQVSTHTEHKPEPRPSPSDFSLLCTKCGGTGTFNGKTCPLCNGNGGISL